MRARLLFYQLLLSPVFLLAQEEHGAMRSIEEVEITAQRRFLAEEAGAMETGIDTSILEQKSTATLSELLSENSSVFIKSNGRGAMATASFRGTAASHTQVVWNGMRLNSPMLGLVDFSLIPVYLIDELSLKHGAASLSERGGGIGGSIQIQNQAPAGEGFRGRFIQGLGSYGTFDEFLQVKFGKGRISTSTRIYHNQSRNNYDFVNRSIGNIDPLSGEVEHPVDTNLHAAYLRYGLLQELYFRPAANQLLSLVYWGQQADRSIPWPTSYEGPDNANLNRQSHADHRASLQWKAYTRGGKVHLNSAWSRAHMDYSQWKRVPGLGRISDISSVSFQESFQNRFSYTHELPGDISVEGRLTADLFRVNSRDTVSQVGYAEDRSELGLFTAFRKSFARGLNLNLMLRQEWIDGQRVPLIPYLGFDLKILGNRDLVFKASVARNYHHPTLNDLYWQPGGNPDLKPEEGFSMEAGLSYREGLGGQELEAMFSLYRTDIRNWIIWIPSPRLNLEPMNVKRVLTYGLEWSTRLEGDLGPVTYRLLGTYAWTPSLNLGDPLVWGDASRGKQLPYVPLHSGNLNLGIDYRIFFMSYQYNAYSERHTTSSNDPGKLGWLYPYFMNDLAAGVKLPLKALQLSLEVKVHNLFNESYHSVLYRPMPGRNYHVIISLGF